MGKNNSRKPKLLSTLAAIATLGTLAILWLLAIELAVLAASALLGLGVAIFKGWVAGGVVAIFSYVIINKILWYFEIFDMICAGSRNKNPGDLAKLDKPSQP